MICKNQKFLVILQAILGTKIIKIIPKIIQNYF